MIQDKTILITGGTGTFGQEMVKVLLQLEPKKIIVYSRDELKQYEMQQKFDNKNLRFFIGDVRDKLRMNVAMREVDFVFHSAALKQVPTCEYNPFEAIKTNIYGAQNVIECAIANRVERVIALSSDKAVNPINLYGATKLCTEKLFVAANTYGRSVTRFSVVRYGNVLASRGSVLQKFIEQANDCGIINVTHKGMTRFWWRIDQAVNFALSALMNMRGGEIFVPKLVSSLVVDLASAVYSQCRVKEIGIRPGEKLHEMLIAQDEVRRVYDFGDAYVIEPEFKFFVFETQGVLVDQGFSYCSKDNCINAEEVRELIECLLLNMGR